MTLDRNLFRWITVAISFIIVSLILWNTYQFSQTFKEEERKKMEIWSKAFDDSNNVTDLSADVNELALPILSSNTSTPMIVVDYEGEMSIRNMPDIDENDTIKIRKLIKEFEKENTPIEIRYNDELLQTIYYDNSSLLKKMKYYPMALLLIILLFGSVIYFFYKSNKNALQNKLWAGMAKETAHQIGTPLSSLIGWLELLKLDDKESTEIAIDEIAKDIDRLEVIADRFSKIGSIPKLERANIVSETENNFHYLKSRSSKLIEFHFETTDNEIYANINKQLFGWTIENLVKNAIDAMKGKGSLRININQLEDVVKIEIHDTGKGIPKVQFKKIFEPGFTTKKRGWGLGLSLAKRIIEDYHKGRIKVKSSELNKGTVMQVSLHTIP